MITFVMAEMMEKMAGRLHSNNQPFAELANVNQLIEKAQIIHFQATIRSCFSCFVYRFGFSKEDGGYYGSCWLSLLAFPVFG